MYKPHWHQKKNSYKHPYRYIIHSCIIFLLWRFQEETEAAKLVTVAMYYLHVLWKMTEVTVLYFVFGSHWQYQVCYSGENCTKADILFCGRTMECENTFLCIIISMSTFPPQAESTVAMVVGQSKNTQLITVAIFRCISTMKTMLQTLLSWWCQMRRIIWQSFSFCFICNQLMLLWSQITFLVIVNGLSWEWSVMFGSLGQDHECNCW